MENRAVSESHNKESLATGKVKITDVRMTQGKRNSCSFLTRRYKCVCLALFGALLFFLVLINFGAFSSNSYYYSDRVCKLEDIETVEDFDRTKFEGKWFGTHTKGLDSSVLAYFLQFYDVRADFKLNKEGKFDLKTIGSKFYGMWCPVGVGHAEAVDENTPQKFTIAFDTPTGKKFGKKPGWILATDYVSYAILYSCWKETSEGTCEPQSAYIALLQRDKRPLTPEKRSEIDGVISSACVNPKALKPLPHFGYCVKDNEEIPDY